MLKKVAPIGIAVGGAVFWNLLIPMAQQQRPEWFGNLWGLRIAAGFVLLCFFPLALQIIKWFYTWVYKSQGRSPLALALVLLIGAAVGAGLSGIGYLLFLNSKKISADPSFDDSEKVALPLEVTFRDSDLFTPEVKQRIAQQFGNFKAYLVSLKISVPDLPPIGIGQKQGTLVTSPLDKPLYQTSYLIGREDLNDPFALTEGYANYIVQASLPTIKKKEQFPFAEHNTRLWIVGLTVSTYFHWSFWDRKKPNHFTPGILALWAMRDKLKKPFTDRLVATAFRLMVDEPDEGAQLLANDPASPQMTKHCEIYLYRKLDVADDLVEGEGTANAHGPNWPTIVEIWKQHSDGTDFGRYR